MFYVLESTPYETNNWVAETIPMYLKDAERLIKARILVSNGNRRYRLINA